MYFPKLNAPRQSRVTVNRFPGLDRRPRGQEGSFREMENLCAQGYPTLTVRRPRGIAGSVTAPGGLTAKDGLIWVDGHTLYINGSAAGLVLSEGKKQLVSMGAWLLIWPDKVWYNTADGTHGNMEKKFSSAEGAYLFSETNAIQGPDGQETITVYALYIVEPCSRDGKTVYTAYDPPSVTFGGKRKVKVGDTTYYYLNNSKPESPKDGDTYIDSDERIPYVYSDAEKGWLAQDAPVVRIRCKEIGSGFVAGDCVCISGVSTKALGGDDLADGNYRTVLAAGTDYLVLDAYAPRASVAYLDDELPPAGLVTAVMDIPDMDYVIEAQNRLWGCK